MQTNILKHLIINLNQARHSLLKSHYMICTLNWAFMEEHERRGAIIIISRLLYFHNRCRPKSKLNFV